MKLEHSVQKCVTHLIDKYKKWYYRIKLYKGQSHKGFQSQALYIIDFQKGTLFLHFYTSLWSSTRMRPKFLPKSEVNIKYSWKKSEVRKAS